MNGRLRGSARSAAEPRRADEELAHLRNELEASRERVLRIVEENADGIVIVDSQGVVLFANPAACEILGRSGATLIGAPFGFPVAAQEIAIVRADGEPRIAELRVVETTWEGEQVRLASLRDVTERTRLQEEVQRVHREQIRMKDEFLSHVSHELRSPLSPIFQITAAMLNDSSGVLDEEQREHLDVIYRNAKHLRAMIEQLLEVTRLEVGKISIECAVLPACEVIEECAASFAPAAADKGIALSVEVQADLPPVYADPERAHQIVANLVGNALNFTDRGGHISVGACDAGEIPPAVRFWVKDSGRGIPRGHIDSIFERLNQAPSTGSTARQGLGLGLYVVKELVTRHGGRVWVESEPDVGSEFSFTLPAFDLASLVTPVVAPDETSGTPVMLITVRIEGARAGEHHDIGERSRSTVRAHLDRCTMPDRDVVLPALGGGNPDTFYILASADDIGTAVLVKRIEEQLRRSGDLVSLGLTAAVSAREILSFSFERGRSRGERAAQIAEAIQKELTVQPCHRST